MKNKINALDIQKSKQHYSLPINNQVHTDNKIFSLHQKKPLKLY